MKFKNKLLIIAAILLVLTSSFIFGETWTGIAKKMNVHLDEGYTLYSNGDPKGAKKEINKAYFGFYEKTGFEKTTKTYISGKRASEIEYDFATIKKDITKDESKSKVRSDINRLKENLLTDASILDGNGGQKSSWTSFLASLFIILREGLEAILVVAAMIAYLSRSGHSDKLKWIYLGIILALIASVILAIVLNMILGLSGAKQEVIEGITMLIAVVVLFYVSNWMVGKAHGSEWKKYLESKVSTSLSNGSLFSLAFGAFLAVFREGAETILFYQALILDTRNSRSMVWLGLVLGFALLIVIYFLIVKLSVKLPIKPFFIATSVLLYFMCISFAGTGVKELQEGDLIGVTNLAHVPTIEILGVYPTLETLIPQIILIAIAIFATVMQIRKAKSKREI